MFIYYFFGLILGHVGSILVPNQGSKRYPLHWEQGGLTTGRPGKSLSYKVRGIHYYRLYNNKRSSLEWNFCLSFILNYVPPWYDSECISGISHMSLPGLQFSSVAQSCPTLRDLMDDSKPRPPCPAPTLGVYSNSSPLSRWCHPTISSSVVPFSFCLQSFPASGSFQMSLLFSSDGQSIVVSA